MKAAIFYGAKDIRVEDVAEPQSVGPGEVRLKPFWCGICGTDVHEYAMGPIVIPSKPHKLNGSILPQILGHEFSAEVLELGKGVTNVKVGDRVDENTVLCIIEAMKVMNEVKAGISGVVEEILIDNAHPVEFGTKMFRII